MLTSITMVLGQLFWLIVSNVTVERMSDVSFMSSDSEMDQIVILEGFSSIMGLFIC